MVNEHGQNSGGKETPSACLIALNLSLFTCELRDYLNRDCC